MRPALVPTAWRAPAQRPTRHATGGYDPAGQTCPAPPAGQILRVAVDDSAEWRIRADHKGGDEPEISTAGGLSALGGLAPRLLIPSAMINTLSWPRFGTRPVARTNPAATNASAGTLPQRRAGGGATRLVLLGGVAGVVAVVAMLGFLDPLSVLITIGGALAVARTTHSGATFELAWQRIEVVVGGRRKRAVLFDAERTIGDFKQLARIHRVQGVQALEAAARALGRPALARAIEQAFAGREGDLLEAWLRRERRAVEAPANAARTVLATLSRLFPAFGLIGTLIGLALLLDDVARSNASGLAAALGVTVLTTLYGAVLANVVVLPLASKVEADVAAELGWLELVACGAAQIRERAYPTAVERAMRTIAGIESLADEEETHVIRLEERAA